MNDQRILDICYTRCKEDQNVNWNVQHPFSTLVWSQLHLIYKLKKDSQDPDLYFEHPYISGNTYPCSVSLVLVSLIVGYFTNNSFKSDVGSLLVVWGRLELGTRIHSSD